MEYSNILKELIRKSDYESIVKIEREVLIKLLEEVQNITALNSLLMSFLDNKLKLINQEGNSSKTNS
ncbi:hypothetical protein [Cytobacillus sp. IB215665]|uniref:hypothetical protein n=1 Tax=Cytobacillus sp. IB215665 TaxID=3097357 RepID=UPI002A0C2562|nr:hypothetical protein [Cytobacillus sp. IB215665]MDX8365455.1 hypothetical protein [Cytobacillus sp. IB215665]